MHFYSFNPLFNYAEVSIEHVLFVKHSRHWRYSNKIQRQQNALFYGAYILLWGPNNKPQNVYVLQRKYDLLRKI